MKKWFLLWVMFTVLLTAEGQYSANEMSQADILYNRGMAYSFAGFLAKDIEKAKIFFNESASLGHAKAMCSLGDIYAIEEAYLNADSALYWYQEAVRHGNNNGLWGIGNIYRYGLKHIQQDFVKAASYYLRGAEAGVANGELYLAYLYFKGLGVRQDYKKSFAIFDKMSGTGNPMAQYFAGLHYRNGYGVARSLDKATLLLNAAEQQGYKQAILENKQPAPENPVQPIAIPAAVNLSDKNGYHRVRHNMNPGSLSGNYKGYAIRYDFSGQYALSIFPLETEFTASGSKITGQWKEGEEIAAKINALFTETALVFQNSAIRKIDHNSTFADGETWDFTNARLNMVQEMDKTIITGNIQLYSHLRKEPGMPLFIYLSRATTDKEKMALSKDAITLTAVNPFKQNITISFKLPVTTSVQLKLLTVDGICVLTENPGTLPAGTYNKTLQLPATLVAGSYVLQLETKEGKVQSKILIKQ